ncbi:SpaA isopeptide-forming pilin-related protein [Anaerosporobacter sp.]
MNKVRITQKMKRVISFLLVLLMVINSATVFADNAEETKEGSEATGQLLKDDQPLAAEDSVSVNDTLTWQVSIDKNELVNGIVIKLPEGVLPDITSGDLDGLTATVDGNKITVTSKTDDEESNGEEDVKATGLSVTTSGTQTLDIPVGIDKASVSDGKINIAGIDLNVKAMANTSTTAAPDSIELLKKKKSVETVITNGSKVSLYDKFILRMKWNSLKNIKAGDSYQVEIPEQFAAPTADGSEKILAQKVPESFPNVPFATVSWKAGDKTLHIEFMDMGNYSVGGKNYDALSLLEDAFIDYECKFNEDLNVNEQGKITIDLLGDSVVITVNQQMPKAPQLDKAVGEWNDQGEVEWTVTYTNAEGAYTGDIPTQLSDKLPDGMVYVEDSANVKVGGVDKTSWANIEDNKLICDLTELQEGETLTFTYRSKLIEEELTSIWTAPDSNRSYTNTVVPKAGSMNAKDVEGNKTSTISTDSWDGKNLLKKESEVVAPTDLDSDWKINWTVMVQSVGRSFNKLILTDLMGEGLILDEESIKVVDASEAPVSVEKPTISDVNGKTQMTLKLVDGGVPNTSEKTYTVTYTTTVKQEYFNQTSNLTDNSVKNYAKIQFEWPEDSGTTRGTFSSPVVSRKPDISNTMITKSGGSYNRAEHYIPWTITVNQNKVNLTKVELVDDLSSMVPEHYFTLDESTEAVEAMKVTITDAVKKGLSDTGVSKAVQDSVVVELVANKLTIKIDNLGKNSFSFKIKTYTRDASFYAGNDDKIFKNTITMVKEGTIVDSKPITVDISSTESVMGTSTVLTKEHVSYDPTSKKLTWRLTVNANETNLGDVIISDKLEEGLSCNLDDVKLNGGSFTGNNTFTVDETTNTIHINLDKVTKKKVITYTTTVDVDSKDFYINDKVDYTNTAKMTSQTNSNEVESTTSLSLSNDLLSKTAVKNLMNLTAEYTVKLNPLGMDLMKGLSSDQKMKLVDTLPDGLYLDLDSVKLYEAGTLDVNKSSGVYTVEMTPESKPVGTDISYDTTTRTLTVDIPDATKGYILTYRTYIVRTGIELTNDIRLEGSVLPATSPLKDADDTIKVDANGNAKFVLPKSKFVSVQIKKVDESGRKLKGAVFGLYKNKTDTTPLVTATCDSPTGICILAVPKSLVKDVETLYWKELQAPEGYAASYRWHELDVTNYDEENIIYAFNVLSGEETSAQIKLKKTDSKDSSKGLAGAIFALYEDEECLTPAMKIGTSDSNGIVTFIGLYPGEKYYIKEIGAPAGYIGSDKIIAITAKRTWVNSDIIPVANEKADVTLTVVKVDALKSTSKLSNAEFQLYYDKDCTLKRGEPQTTGKDGTLSFIGLYPNHTYYLKETTAPEGYELATDVYTIITGKNGEVITKEISNDRIPGYEKGSIEITKTNEDKTKVLSGASFALYADDKTTLIEELSTDKSGIVSFTWLDKGTYYVKEMVAPEGYVLSKDWIEVTLTGTETISLTVTNEEIIEEPVNPPSEPEEPSEPQEPTKPVKPVKPEKPVEPQEPQEPQNPENPVKPEEPQNPETPDKPDVFNPEDNGDDGTQPKDNDKKTNGSLPKTGVTTHFALWLTGIAISLLAAIALVVIWRRQNKRRDSK